MINNETFTTIIKSNNIAYLGSKPHPFFAGFCECYILHLIVLGAFAFMESVLHIFLSNLVHMTIGLILTVICIIAVVFYYECYSKKNHWLSPGERIAGRYIVDGEKRWLNPYFTNRWMLFLLSVLTFIILGNQFNLIGTGRTYLLGVLLGKFAGVILQIFGLILIGKGRLKGSIVLVITYAFGLTIGVIYDWTTPLFYVNHVFYMILFILYPIVSLIYYFVRKNRHNALSQ